jgi:hypothetical protein
MSQFFCKLAKPRSKEAGKLQKESGIANQARSKVIFHDNDQGQNVPKGTFQRHKRFVMI